MARRVYLGIDLGAESGRVIAGLWDGRVLELDEIHRFPNRPVMLGGVLRWDILRLWEEIQVGLAMAARKHGRHIVSVGCDAWGLDYALLSKGGELLGLPCHYRDARNNGMLAKAFKVMPRAGIFAETGLQFMQINTLYQLLALKKASPETLDAADCLLMIPDFIHWALCGARGVELTVASTTQLLNPLTRRWSARMIEAFGLPKKIFPKLQAPGSTLGAVRPIVAEATGLGRVRVVAPPSHDTASAVVGAPAADSNAWAYISSGTWSLMGVEIKSPVMSEEAQQLNFTNELGVDGTYRLLRNIMGLWVVQQCRKSFEARGGKITYDGLSRMAANAPELVSVINVDDPGFLNPPDMPKAIQEFCRQTRQPVPHKEGELIRCVYEGLALKYREVLDGLERLIDRDISVVHIVGGGAHSAMLNQFTADACERTVVAGPVEATATGNLLTQIRADGELASLAEMRAVVRKSFRQTIYQPRNSNAWREAAQRLASLPVRR